MWTSDIETTVFSRVKTEGVIALKKKYPDIFFTTENETEDAPMFPTVYIQELPGIERGRDLEGIDINGAMFTFQIDVTDNSEDGKGVAKEVMNQVMKTMKSMRFEAAALPVYRKENGVYTGTARFRRVIGSLDTL